jgi:Zn-dependent protease
VKFTIHPLFIAYGVITAIFGGFPIFIIYALTALLHECGHVFYAGRLGFYCEKVSLTPYGAAAVCDTSGISAVDEVKLALAGPAVNCVICLLVAGLWWFYPVTYAYTDTVFMASAVMLTINLLPAYPLDGGRVARCALLKKLSKKWTDRVLKGSSLLCAAGFIVAFFLVYKSPTILMFAGFLLTSVFEKEVPSCKINYAAKKVKGGREMRYILLDDGAIYKDAIKYLSDSKYAVFVAYDGGNITELYEDELYEKLLTHSIYDPLWE